MIPQLKILQWFIRCCCLVTKSCPTFCDPVDYSLLGSSVHGIFQARILEWVAISSSRGLPDPHWTCSSALAGRFFTTEPPGKTTMIPYLRVKVQILSFLTCCPCQLSGFFHSPFMHSSQAPPASLLFLESARHSSALALARNL